ncbi:uncharacterized protein LOC115290411 [Suricata suricatta]|uniref:uncharacterized protein LOC115290411 n=1 Tax=Suricata suricatta TaxID=37032 RepID=UPI001155F385|nr:uncharacterized protein LOC115290411 [Suricata suricatta]
MRDSEAQRSVQPGTRAYPPLSPKTLENVNREEAASPVGLSHRDTEMSTEDNHTGCVPLKKRKEQIQFRSSPSKKDLQPLQKQRSFHHHKDAIALVPTPTCFTLDPEPLGTRPALTPLCHTKIMVSVRSTVSLLRGEWPGVQAPPGVVAAYCILMTSLRIRSHGGTGGSGSNRPVFAGKYPVPAEEIDTQAPGGGEPGRSVIAPLVQSRVCPGLPRPGSKENAIREKKEVAAAAPMVTCVHRRGCAEWGNREARGGPAAGPARLEGRCLPNDTNQGLFWGWQHPLQAAPAVRCLVSAHAWVVLTVPSPEGPSLIGA